MKKVYVSLFLSSVCQLSQAGGPVTTADRASGPVAVPFVSQEAVQLSRIETRLTEMQNTNMQIAALLAKLLAENGSRPAK